jgi:hypothetical protein
MPATPNLFQHQPGEDFMAIFEQVVIIIFYLELNLTILLINIGE